MVLCLHIGAGFDLIQLAPEAPIDHLIVLTSQITMLIAQDLLFGPTLRKFPDLKVALSEGGIGWIPFYLDRVDRHFQNQAWLDNDFGGKLPSDVFREHFLACYITDPSGLEAAPPHRHGHHRLGVRLPAHRHDVAGLARVRLEGVPGRRRAPTTRSTRSRGRTPVASSTGTRSSTPPRSRRRSARCGRWPTDVDTTRMPREEWRKRNEAAGIGVF